MIYAGFWVRIFAAFIDLIVTTPVFIAVLYVLGINLDDILTVDQLMSGNVPERTKSHNIADFVSYVILISYSVYFVISKRQATLGKMLMNIHIETTDGEKLSVNRAFARFLSSVVSLSFFGLGIIMIAFTKEKIAFHDLICKTRVVYNKKL